MKNSTIITIAVILFALSTLTCFVGFIVYQDSLMTTNYTEPFYQLGLRVGNGLVVGVKAWGLLVAIVFTIVILKTGVKEVFFKRG